MKTLARVATEMALHVLAYNIKRVIAILGVPKLIEAIAGLIAWLVIEMGPRESGLEAQEAVHGGLHLKNLEIRPDGAPSGRSLHQRLFSHGLV